MTHAIGIERALEAALAATVGDFSKVGDYVDFNTADAREFGVLREDENFAGLDIIRHDQNEECLRHILKPAIEAAIAAYLSALKPSGDAGEVVDRADLCPECGRTVDACQSEAAEAHPVGAIIEDYGTPSKGTLAAEYFASPQPPTDVGEATGDWHMEAVYEQIEELQQAAKQADSEPMEALFSDAADMALWLVNLAEVAEYKRGQAVNEIQPMIIARAEAAERQLATAREDALEEAAAFFTAEAARMYEEAMTHPMGMKRRAAENAAGYHTSVAEIIRALTPGVSDAE